MYINKEVEADSPRSPKSVYPMMDSVLFGQTASDWPNFPVVSESALQLYVQYEILEIETVFANGHPVDITESAMH